MDYFACGTIFVPHVFIHEWIHRVVLGNFNNIFTVENSAHTSNVDVMCVFNCYVRVCKHRVHDDFTCLLIEQLI